MAEIHWFYAKGDEQLGPVGPAELKQLAATGALSPDDLVWREGMAAWAPAARVAGLFNGRDSDSQVVVRQPANSEVPQAAPVSQEPLPFVEAGVARRAIGPAKTLIRLQIGVWICCLAVVLIGAGSFALSLANKDAAERTSAGISVIALALTAYIVARSAEKLLELVLSYLDGRRPD